MAKLPSFNFYPGDWLKDANLRRCTHAAKGVWIDMLCLMFDSEQRGVLATAGRPWSDVEVALAVGGDQSVTLACIAELTLKGVAHRSETGALYSKRLIRDEQKRRLCSEAGKRGGNPTLKGAPKGAPKRNITPSSSISISTSVEPPYPLAGFSHAFQMSWDLWPPKRRTKREAAQGAWNGAIARLAFRFESDPRKAEDWLLERVRAYVKAPRGKSDFCLGIAKWLLEGSYDDAPEAWQDDGDDAPTASIYPDLEPMK